MSDWNGPYKSNPVAIKGFRDVRRGDIKRKYPMCDAENKQATKVALDGVGHKYALACAHLCLERSKSTVVGEGCETFSYIVEGRRSRCVMHKDKSACGVSAKYTGKDNHFPFILDPSANPDGWDPTPDPPAEADSYMKPAMVPGGPPPSGGGGGGGGGGISVGPQPGQSTAPRQGGGSSAPTGGQSSLMGMLVILAVFAVLLGGLYFLHKKSGILTRFGVPPISPGAGPEALVSKLSGGSGKSKSTKKK